MVSFALVVGSRAVLVLLFRVAVDSFVHNVGSSVVLVRVFFAFGVGFGRSACAAVSFGLFLGSAPRVGRPRRNSAGKCGVRAVCLPCLNIAPSYTISGNRPVGLLSRIRRFEVPEPPIS